MKVPIAPLVLLVYRRPDHTRRLFDVVRRIKPSTLYIVADGPDGKKIGDASRVRATRKELNAVDWDCKVTEIYAEENMGLKNRIVSGLDEVFLREDRAIILEDDCLPAESFFPFASELLERFKADERLGIISGSQRLDGRKLSPASYEFSKDVRIWGWATWARTWNNFSHSGELDAEWTAKEVRRIGALFPPGSRRRSMVSMMKNAKSLDSWALPFAVHCAKIGYLNPVSSENLISNIGVGDESTHTVFENWTVQVPRGELSFPLVHQENVVYGGYFDALESKSDFRRLIGYPLRHPINAFGRIAKFMLKRIGSKLKRPGTLS